MSEELPEEILSDEIDAFLGEDPEEAPAAEEVEPEGEEEAPEEEDASEEEGEAEEAAEPETPMPASWSKEDAKAWGDMTPEQRAVVARREGERDKFLRGKSMEAAQTRQKVENEARDIIVRQHEDYAQKLAVYAQQFTAPAPDQRLLYTGNPDDVLTYQRQDAAFRASADHQQQLNQQIAQAQAQAEHARKQAHQSEIQADAQRLQEQLPEWFDPSEGPKLQQQLQSIGAELGYPNELMNEASSVDILALKKAAEWKAKAAKLDELMGKKMETVRAAKGLPKMARPGVKPSKGQASATARDQAWDRVKTTKDPMAFAEWAEKSGIM